MKSYMGENNFFTNDSNIDMNIDVTFNMKHTFILLLFVLGLAFYVYGALNLDFGMNEMTAIFLIIAIGAGIKIGRASCRERVKITEGDGGVERKRRERGRRQR